MIKRFEVRNYRNFFDSLVLDLSKTSGYQFNQDCINNNIISKGIIYGKNAVGKTNLGNAICDIRNTLVGKSENNNVLNADSFEKYAYFRYDFRINEEDIIYEYTKSSNDSLLMEKLIVNELTIYELDYSSRRFTTIDLEAIEADSIQADKFLMSLDNNEIEAEEDITVFPFLRFLFNNFALPYNSTLRNLERFILGIRVFNAKSRFPIGLRATLKRSDYLSKGNHLSELQTFLNKAGVECELELEELPDGSKELYFVHNNKISVFDSASSGTQSLMNMYFRLIQGISMRSFIYYDEFDAFYHYELSEYIVKYLKDNMPNTQILFTTHNTNLMNNQLMRPDCLYILSSKGRILPLCDATERELREGHNLEKLYIAGEFNKYE